MSTPTATSQVVGQKINVIWSPPAFYTGIIVQYIVNAYINNEITPRQTANVSGSTLYGWLVVYS